MLRSRRLHRVTPTHGPRVRLQESGSLSKQANPSRLPPCSRPRGGPSINISAVALHGQRGGGRIWKTGKRRQLRQAIRNEGVRQLIDAGILEPIPRLESSRPGRLKAGRGTRGRRVLVGSALHQLPPRERQRLKLQVAEAVEARHGRAGQVRAGGVIMQRGEISLVDVLNVETVVTRDVDAVRLSLVMRDLSDSQGP
eukprot:UN1014